MMSRRKQGVANLFLLLTALSPLTVLAQNRTRPLPKKKNPELVGNRDINKHQLNFYSLQQEIALGQQLAAQVEMQMPMVRDPAITEYVNRVGQNLALNSDVKVPLTIKVIASDEINAFALPGGFLYVNMGILKLADSESELAGVMAHEIAHIAARHALENLSKRNLMSLGMIPLIFVGGSLGGLARQGADLGTATLFFKFSRGAEKEADELGAQYLWAAGYNPWSLISFFEKMQRREPQVRVSSLFRTHPATPDRIKNVRKLISRFPGREHDIANTEEFDRIKGRWSGGFGSRPEYAGSGANNGSRPPVLRRRREGGPPSVGDPDRPSPGPPPVDNQGQPSILNRRAADESSSVGPPRRASSPPASGDGRQPPVLYRRTSPGTSSGDTSPTTYPLPVDKRQPPVLYRRTWPGSQNNEGPEFDHDANEGTPPGIIDRTSPNRQTRGRRYEDARPAQSPVVRRPGSPSRSLSPRPLHNRPPRLHRRY